MTTFTREGHITADPTFNRADNEVTITCETAGATIYYSMDAGDLPETIYESPVTFTENAPSGYMQAQAVAPEMVPSNIVGYAIDWFKCEDVTFRTTGSLNATSLSLSPTAQNIMVGESFQRL